MAQNIGERRSNVAKVFTVFWQNSAVSKLPNISPSTLRRQLFDWQTKFGEIYPCYLKPLFKKIILSKP